MFQLLALISAAGWAAAPGSSADGTPLIRIEGRWVLDAAGQPVAPKDFERGLQTGALVLRKGEFWSIGDQRAEWPGALIRIDPKTARLIGGPIVPKLEEPPGGNPLFKEYTSLERQNPDFEGLAMDPRDPSILYGVTEDKWMRIVRFRIEDGPPPRARIDQITALEFPDVKPVDSSEATNYRLEGIALTDDGRTTYLAWERALDRLPIIFSLSTEDAVSGKSIRPQLVPVDFAAVKPRADKPKALLNLNDIQFIRRGGRPALLAVARDQERILLIALPEGKVTRVVDLDLRTPEGDPILWVSPEGLAFDEATDRLWLINDPDSIRGNYRKLSDPKAEGNFAAMAPLLFETKLSAVLGGK